MGIDKLNSAAWAAGFAMAPIEDDAPEPIVSAPHAEMIQQSKSRWRPAQVPALIPDASGGPSVMRQWLSGWQRKATA